MASGDEQEFLFAYGLPAGRSMFTLKELSGWWKISIDQLYILASAGEFEDGDLRPINFAKDPKHTRATLRVPRAGVIAFLKRRKHKS